jgi:hypothetical protein
MHRFFLKDPHSRVYGHPVVFYEQLGKYFTKDGREVDCEGKEIKDTLHLKKKNGLAS